MRRSPTLWPIFALLLVGFLLGGPFALASLAPTATATTLTVSPSSVSAGTVVTFTASVSNGSPVTPGLVTFCDATATYCEDSAIIGTAQLTSAGTAVIRIPPPIGSHIYKAVFNGTTSNTKSTSSTQSLTVTGTHATTTAISASGSTGNYTLTGTVIGTGIASPPPTGSVSFVDTTNSYTLGSAALWKRNHGTSSWDTGLLRSGFGAYRDLVLETSTGMGFLT